jgi:FixJ family two-component response regulator
MSDESYFIAVIDDDESMCQALSRMLRLAGYDVRTYFSAESFMDDSDHVHARFAVTDIQLRGMSGFDLQRRLRQELPALPVAFITAHDEPATRAQARDSGCVAYFRKPFPTSKLLEAIHSALAPTAPTSNPPFAPIVGNHAIPATGSVPSTPKPRSGNNEPK